MDWRELGLTRENPCKIVFALVGRSADIFYALILEI